MKKEYAYSTLQIKSMEESDDEGIITGLASSPVTDRTGDIVEPMGAQFKLPIPLLWQHNANKPIGHVIAAKVTKSGIEIKAQVVKGVLQEIDDIWKMIKAGLVRGLSIGFRSLESADIDGTWGIRFTKWEWLELSAVTIPANQDASISMIKSVDEKQRGVALDADDHVSAVRRTAVKLKTPGDSGHRSKSPINPKGNGMTTKDRIAAMEASRAAKAARMTELLNKTNDEDRTFDDAETEEYDLLGQEIKKIDGHLVRLNDHEALMKAQATVVDGDQGTDPDLATKARQSAGSKGAITFQKSNLPKGTGFTRLAMAVAASKGSNSDALLYVKQYRDTPEVEIALKAAIAAGTTSDANWAAPLVQYTDLANEFIELLYPQTIIGKLPGLRRVPFNIRMAKVASGTSVGWVGQGLPKPLSQMDFDTVSMTWAKIAGIVVLTEELVRFSSPAAEAIVRDDMIKAISTFMDQQFIDPTVAAVSNVSPASITNGVSATNSSGGTIAQITADINALMTGFATANLDPSRAAWIMRPRTAQYLATLRTAQDIYAYPGISMMGGTFQGMPVIVSNSVPFDTGNSTYIFLVDASEILLADDGGVRLDASNQASLQMDSAPSAGAQSLVSLWQNNMVGLRAERFINWMRRRDQAVAVLADVAY